MHRNPMSLHDSEGQRKYLNQKERLRFLEVTWDQPSAVRLFSQLLYYTGARIAEIYNLTPERIDVDNQTVIIESLKKRQAGVFREIPLPDFLLEDILLFTHAEQIKISKCLWPFSLRTASRRIKQIMVEAEIKGIRSSAKGLRHGFAVNAVTKAPLTLVKKWLGHGALETTEIYLNIVGNEERKIAKAMWYG